MSANLVVDSVTVRFGGSVVLDEVCLSIEPGQPSGLIGPNGAGKTTLFDAITGFVRPQGGRILIGGRDVSRMSPVQRARIGIRRSFQSVELFADLTVLDNLRVAVSSKSGMSAEDLLSRLGIEEYSDVRAESVPAGAQRLVGIARALAGNPSVLLLDEPGAGMQATEISHLANRLREICVDSDLTMLIVDHDMDLIDAACDVVTVLDFGKVIAHGSPSEVKKLPAVVEAYLGVV